VNATAEAPTETDAEALAEVSLAARVDAERKCEAYEKLRDDFIETLIGLNLTDATRVARRKMKEACAKARLLDAPVRTSDSVAVILAGRNAATGRDSILELQRNVTSDL
jgi:hypothetical protein